jgi:hypothetical protein
MVARQAEGDAGGEVGAVFASVSLALAFVRVVGVIQLSVSVRSSSAASGSSPVAPPPSRPGSLRCTGSRQSASIVQVA